MRKVGQLAAVGTVANTTHPSVALAESEGQAQVEVEITAVGATPTVTYKVQGSFDDPGVADAASDWADLELDPMDNSAAATSFVKTAVAVHQYAIPEQNVPRKIRLVSSAILNVTYEAEVYA